MKIYNEVVIDMNPESSTFEEVLYEDSYDYDGDDIMLALSEDLDLNFDLEMPEGFMWSTLSEEQKQVWIDAYGTEPGAMTAYNTWLQESKALETTGLDEDARKESQQEFITRQTGGIGERGLGMGDIRADDMLGKTEDEMLKWIIDTRYGGQLPANISENDLLTQIRTKLPQKGGIGTTDWYGIQGVGKKVGEAKGSIYGGSMRGMRGSISGQKKIGRDIYALEDKKGDEWTSKFRDFLSGLPSSTGT